MRSSASAEEHLNFRPDSEACAHRQTSFAVRGPLVERWLVFAAMGAAAGAAASAAIETSQHDPADDSGRLGRHGAVSFAKWMACLEEKACSRFFLETLAAT